MNNKYEIIIYWSQEDNSFLAEVPEWAVCMADRKCSGRHYRMD